MTPWIPGERSSSGRRSGIGCFSSCTRNSMSRRSESSARGGPPGTNGGDMKKKASNPREPSRASLREIPEVDFDRARVRRNPYAARVAAEGIVHVGRGRPKKGTETGPTVPRSVRFPAQLCKLLEAKAKAEGLTLHSALRAAILEWAKRAP